jgi:N-hydroxyarylamine O-acetyltransferase
MDVDAYLARIGAARPARADAAALRELQLRHLLTVPFENLSIHLGEPIVLGEEALVDKVVRRRRGGFCYELNGAFAALLSALGYSVALLNARAFTPEGLGPPYDHLALRVDMAGDGDGGEGALWLADVGFGRFSNLPLRLDGGEAEQADPAGAFRIVEQPDGDLDVLMNGEAQYRLDPRPRALGDFEATCWWHQTSPKSHFSRSLVCSLVTETGRLTLSGRTFVRTTGGVRDEHELTDDADVFAAYRTYFGITLDRVPSVRSVPSAGAGPDLGLCGLGQARAAGLAGAVAGRLGFGDAAEAVPVSSCDPPGVVAGREAHDPGRVAADVEDLPPGERPDLLEVDVLGAQQPLLDGRAEHVLPARAV